MKRLWVYMCSPSRSPLPPPFPPAPYRSCVSYQALSLYKEICLPCERPTVMSRVLSLLETQSLGWGSALTEFPWQTSFRDCVGPSDVKKKQIGS